MASRAASTLARNVQILSAGHSGSTLLNLLLGNHSRVAAVSELTHFPMHAALNLRCTCGTPLRGCEFWRGVARDYRESAGVDILAQPLKLNLGYLGTRRQVDGWSAGRGYRTKWGLQHALVYGAYRFGIALPGFMQPGFQEALAHTAGLYRSILRVSGADVVVDASKGYLKGTGIYRISPRSTKVVLLARDGRGSFYSRLKRGYGRRESLAAWRHYYARALPLLKTLVPSSDLLTVQYEKLVQSPEDEMRRLCEFLGLRYERQTSVLGASTQHGVGGNRMRFLEGEATIRPDSAWHERMTRPDRDYFELRAGALNRALGYQ